MTESEGACMLHAASTSLDAILVIVQMLQMYRRLSWMLLPSQVKMHLRLCKLLGVTSHSIVGFMCQSFQPTFFFSPCDFHERPVVFISLRRLMCLHTFMLVNPLSLTLLAGMHGQLAACSVRHCQTSHDYALVVEVPRGADNVGFFSTAAALNLHGPSATKVK
jgi:hypothetical protein